MVMVLQENWEDGHVTLTTPTSLPELKERTVEFYDRQRSFDGEFVSLSVTPLYSTLVIQTG